MRGFACIGLVRPKSPENVGSVLRAAYCYDAAMVAIEKQRAAWIKHGTNTPQTQRNTPVIQCDDLYDVIPYDTIPVAVDLIEGAKPLPDFTHPERAFYIFGPEDGTLGKKVTDWCKHTVYIPTKTCMNLAATVNVVLYDRMMKGVKQ